jgi:predicted dienelactone hydrolase
MRPLTALVAAGVLLVACSDSGGDDAGPPASTAPVTSPVSTPATAAPTTAPIAVAPTTTALTTTTAPAPPALFTADGPFAVGIVTLDLADRHTDVYYPVDPSAVSGQPTEQFQTIEALPESLRPVFPVELQATFDTGAVRDAPASEEGPFPVVIYSHGFGGYRQVATFYTSHLASWGFVVASTDHVERGLVAQATGQVQQTAGRDLEDVANTLSALDTANTADGSQLAGAVDLDHVGITGHSAGASTAVRAALALAEIDAYISVSGGPAVDVSGDDVGTRFASVADLAPGSYEVTVAAVEGDQVTASVDGGELQTVPRSALTLTVDEGSITFAVAETATIVPGTVVVTYAVPEQPALVVTAEDDGVVPAARSIALYEGLGPQKWFVEVALAGHNSFTDTCPEILARGGLEALRPLIGRLVDLAQDGCTPGVADPLLVQDVLDHYSTAFFLQTLRGEDRSSSLSAEVMESISGIELSDFQSA